MRERSKSPELAIGSARPEFLVVVPGFVHSARCAPVQRSEPRRRTPEPRGTGKTRVSGLPTWPPRPSSSECRRAIQVTRAAGKPREPRNREPAIRPVVAERPCTRCPGDGPVPSSTPDARRTPKERMATRVPTPVVPRSAAESTMWKILGPGIMPGRSSICEISLYPLEQRHFVVEDSPICPPLAPSRRSPNSR